MRTNVTLRTGRRSRLYGLESKRRLGIWFRPIRTLVKPRTTCDRLKKWLIRFEVGWQISGFQEPNTFLDFRVQISENKSEEQVEKRAGDYTNQLLGSRRSIVDLSATWSAILSQ
jgi:hypothetical protein